MTDEIRVNYLNFPRVKALSPEDYGVIRFDSNNQCNVHCVYCHIPAPMTLLNWKIFARFSPNGF
jgi:hypothetical protein